MNESTDLKTGEKGAWISIFAYLILAAVKLIVGITYHSEALRADGLNNSTDIIASVAILIGLKISQYPPDSDHPYGHYRAETISSLIASFIMMMVGLEVLIEAGKSILRPKEASPGIVAGWTAGISAIFMFGVYLYIKRLADRINSHALMAAAKDNFSDAIVSVGTCVGVFSSRLQLPWIDTVFAFIIGIIICKTAWDIFRDATHSLTDGFDRNDLEAYQQSIQRIEGVHKLTDIKARYLGSTVHLEASVVVNSALTTEESHKIADEVENKMKHEHGVSHVHVHIEPSDIK
ncbi:MULTISPECIES: cation diffusion facilitator family transporter [Bacillus]|uniref:Transporter n=2 Tax=Bacillus TaxID=1386 RepID=A0A0M4FV06_9BACI|nr:MULTISPECIES: cation diffusion facilitator family transporter [Bacillus]ALC83797.1 transporter [Bacillus gobiensis]MBP1084027.1 cation diffusion facilitator family transporter [Bacillus capparidis]MED1096928.1 cation diffusion facilitator family transporter [Bacillus capparidis]